MFETFLASHINVYLCRGKPKTVAHLVDINICFIIALNLLKFSLAADGQNGNILQLEKFRLDFSSCFRAYSKQLDFLCPWLTLSIYLL